MPNGDRWKWSTRCAVGFFSFGSVALLYAYQSTLIASLTRPTMKRYPQNTFELIQEGTMSYVMNKHGLGAEIVMVFIRLGHTQLKCVFQCALMIFY